MFEGKRILALIPARGGSKRLPRKNVLSFSGKPLIAHTIDACKKSKYVDRVIVTTDDAEVFEIANRFGAEVPFIRPTHLSTDSATTNDVVMHALNMLSEKPDILLVLQPTSPLRDEYDIDSSIEMLFEKKADGIVSVCKCEHSPLWTNVLPADHSLRDFIKPASQLEAQKLKEYYRLNGAIYCFNVSFLSENFGISYNGLVYAYIMGRNKSVDIDTIDDLEYAEFLLKNC
ncbi:cytidylyltransferase domain-containing protein [Rheinheimera sp.]|uniref:acylneuraminate cytidylyltransferase family protein n=1 Tax=Rheinheimera sp. TaxID=1869214 RepID=UPI002734DA71|nr:acylneuraminate cytidylyltransferase family protein [Rheinheimera sp.]MDP2715676.1 acylneuraminate cytidylyltransferase family protein [Rheinheimera sp.]